MKKRHQVLFVLSILSVITFLDRIAISTAGKRITDELGLSDVQWGWVLGIFTLSYGIFEIPTGLLGDSVKVLIELVNQVPNLIHLEEYLKLIKDKFLRRSLIKFGT